MEKEFGELKGTIYYIADSLGKLRDTVEKNNDSIFNIVQKNNDAAAEFREFAAAKLAAIETTLSAQVIPYMDRCDSRAVIDRDDIDELKLWRERQAGRTYGSVAAISLMISILAWSFTNLSSFKAFFK